MKNIFLILIITTAISCKSQTPILPRYAGDFGDIEGAYYKDIDNFHDQFVGTWVYTSGLKKLTVKLRKLTMHNKTMASINFFADYLVGEYEYIDENGVQKVNTLGNINNDYASVYDYNLYGIIKITNDKAPVCADCLPSDKRLVMRFTEPTRLHPWAPEAEFVIRLVVEGGVTKLKVQYDGISSSMGAPTTELQNFSFQPYGDYTLIKQ